MGTTPVREMEPADGVWIVHVLIVAACVWTPFWAPIWVLPYYAAAGVLMISHWELNHDVCVLTQLEDSLRGTAPTKGIVYAILHPFFGGDDQKIGLIVECIASSLVALAVVRYSRGIQKPYAPQRSE